MTVAPGVGGCGLGVTGVSVLGWMVGVAGAVGGVVCGALVVGAVEGTALATASGLVVWASVAVGVATRPVSPQAIARRTIATSPARHVSGPTFVERRWAKRSYRRRVQVRGNLRSVSY
jgi:hypothetical protein